MPSSSTSVRHDPLTADPFAAMADIDWARARMIEPQRFEAACRSERRRSAIPAGRYGELFDTYTALKKRRGVVDFDDLLLLTNELFNNYPEILERHQQRFDHVQVDEYQDTNGTQFELIEALVREHQNLCVVGDDDQSIYGWRGAEVRHILGFANYFPGAKTVRLEDNYRCTDEILNLANTLVRHNRERHNKTLRATKKSKDPVRFQEYEDEQIEAEMVVREIRFYIQQKGVAARDFCTLFRTNEQPRVFEQEMRRAGVPYLLMGSQSFYDRKEIKDILLSYDRTLLVADPRRCEPKKFGGRAARGRGVRRPRCG